jgi:hypothetical protein
VESSEKRFHVQGQIKTMQTAHSLLSEQWTGTNRISGREVVCHQCWSYCA